MIGETRWLNLSHVGSKTVDEILFPMFSSNFQETQCQQTNKGAQEINEVW